MRRILTLVRVPARAPPPPADRGFEVVWADAARFAAIMKNDDVEIAEAMKITGQTK